MLPIPTDPTAIETTPSLAVAQASDIDALTELKRRSEMLDAVGYAASTIVGSSDWKRGIPELLCRLGHATEVSRVTLFEIHPGPDGRLCESCRYDWAAPGFQTLSDDPRYQNLVIVGEDGQLEDWAIRRQRGEVIQATLAEVTGDVRRIFLEHSTLAFVSVPILLRDRWWGFLGFDDCVRERRWSELEIGILKTAAALIAGAIERGEADERLRISEERYALAARGANDGLLDIDLKTGRGYLSPRLHEILGLEDGGLGGSARALLAQFLSDDVAATRRYFRDCFALKQPTFRTELRQRQKDGTIRWFVARGVVTYDGETPIRVVGSLRDITDFRRTEHSLRRSEARVRAILNAATDAIITTDERGLVVGFNPAAARMFGFDEATVTGRPIGEIIVPHHLRDAHLNGMRRYVATGQPHVLGQLIEIEALRSDGTVFPVELTVTEVPLPDGRLFTAIIRDVSERKRFQQDLAEADRQRAVLARHFSPNMVEELMRAGGKLDDMRTQPIAVLFADLFNFTEISAESTSTEVIDLLRHFHALVEEAVFSNDGTLDKYIGDGVMATFGTPRPGKRDATHAIRCARQLVRGINRWNRQREARGLRAIQIGIGVHYGEATLGNVGSARRFEHTVVGETVNLASRIEHLTRTLDCAILASDALAAAVRSEGGDRELAGFQAIGAHAVRGHRHPISLWSLTALALAEQDG